VHSFSLSVARIELLHQWSDNSVVGAVGTAFFYRSAGQPFLITNWHNVTGLHPQTGKSLHSKGLIPNVLRLHYKKWVDETKKVLQSQPLDLSLSDDGRPTWFEHSSRNAVDVVALPLTAPDDCANVYINEVEQEQRLEAAAGMDCFILGFPEGLFGAAFTPIWKRGSIAAEPYLQHPYYIDSATRRGMSGSPVIIRHNGMFGMIGGVLTGAEVIGTVERFVAIYSDRIGDDELGGQLGRAWQSSVLDDVLTLATPGEHPLVQS
jgi:hypothetical protein